MRYYEEELETLIKAGAKVVEVASFEWDLVDSCVSLYEEAGAQVFEVNTLNQLAHFVEQM